MPRAINTMSVVAAAAVLCGAATGAVGAEAHQSGSPPPASVVAEYDTPSTPGAVRYAYGAAWVTAPAARSVLRIAPGAETPTTTRLPGRILDITEGYGRIWVLWSSGARSYLAALDPRTGRLVGSARRSKLEGRPTDIEAGAGAVWASRLGLSFRARAVLSRVHPSTRRVTARRWPTPAGFFVERGLIWSFTGQRLVKRAPATLRTRGSVRAFSGYNAVTYGLGNFWTSSLGPTADGGVTRVSPAKGRGPVYEFPGESDVNDAGGIVTGAGTIWAAWQTDESSGGGSWDLVGFSPSGDAGQIVQLPISASPEVAYGAGALWVTDTAGKRILAVAPPSA